MGARVRFHRGAFWVFINHRGQRRSQRIGTGESGKLAAREVAKRIAAKLALGESLDTGQEIPTFDAYSATWLARVRQTCKHDTYQNYEGAVRYELRPAFQGLTLDQITRARVRDLATALLAKGHAVKTCQNLLRTLSACCGHAVEDGLLTVNPALRPGKLLPKVSSRRAVHPLTREEIALLLTTAQQRAPRYYPAILTACRTGVRLGELLALQWADLNLAGRYLEVRRNFTHGQLTTPKNGESRRVDLSKALCQVLTDLYTERQLEAAANHWTALSPWIFTTETGERLDGDHLRKQVFYALLTAAGLSRCRWHDLRHSYARLLLEDGTPLTYVKAQLGHSSIQITADLYGTWIPSGDRTAVDRLDQQPEDKSSGGAESASRAHPAHEAE